MQNEDELRNCFVLLGYYLEGRQRQHSHGVDEDKHFTASHGSLQPNDECHFIGGILYSSRHPTAIRSRYAQCQVLEWFSCHHLSK